MFKDTDRELARLSEELLMAEQEDESDQYEEEEDYEDYDEEFDEEFDEAYEEEYEEDYGDDYEDEAQAPPEYIYDDTRAARGPAVYQNYSNDYGRNLRNYASGYRAYNSDDCDEDLDAFSEEVYEEPQEKSNTGLVVLACILATILGAAALFAVLKYKGVL